MVLTCVCGFLCITESIFLKFCLLLAVLISLRQWHLLFPQKNVSPTCKLLFSSQHYPRKLALTSTSTNNKKFNVRSLLYFKLRPSRGGTPKHTQTLIDATQKETAIDQQQHSCETLICQRHQTILRLLSSAATVSTRWRVRELYCQTTYIT